MRKPPTMHDASKRRLLVTEGNGVHTFSNGSDWDSWAHRNCFACRFYDRETAGTLCAFESAAWLNMVSPDLAELFGWTQDKQYDKPDDHRHGWKALECCSFFNARPDSDGGEDVPPPPPDPNQLTLLVDPTEDLARFPASPADVDEPVLAGASSRSERTSR